MSAIPSWPPSSSSTSMLLLVIVTTILRTFVIEAEATTTSTKANCHFDKNLSTLVCRNVDNFAVVRSSLKSNLDDDITRIDIFGGKFATLPNFIDSESFFNESTLLSVQKVSVVQSGVKNVSPDLFDGFEIGLIIDLDLSGNDLELVPEVVLQLYGLEVLNLADNRIVRLPPGSAFNSLNSLISLDLSNNRIGYQRPNIKTTSNVPNNSSLTLVNFNLEPLTDTIQTLSLRGNHLDSLPMQFRGRNFARMRSLDLSHNSLSVLPADAFVGMNELETLNVEHTGLRTFTLAESAAPQLKNLLLAGNPIDCDCHARWLWNVAKNSNNNNVSSNSNNNMSSGNNNETRRLKILDVPSCSTPFSVKNLRLESLEESVLCDLFPGNRVPRFFRVSKQDESSFPATTFDSLGLDDVSVDSDDSISVKWHVGLGFYYSDYDWGLIFRRIGDVENPNMFFKTRHDLKSHVEKNADDWTPKDETFDAVLDSMEQDTYYEVCLAVIDHSTVYYLHRSHCKEVRTRKSPKDRNGRQQLSDGPVRTTNISVVADTSSVTVRWNVTVAKESDADKASRDEIYTLIRRISLRPFGSDNVTRLFVLEDFNLTSLSNKSPPSPRYYTLLQNKIE